MTLHITEDQISTYKSLLQLLIYLCHLFKEIQYMHLCKQVLKLLDIFLYFVKYFVLILTELQMFVQLCINPTTNVYFSLEETESTHSSFINNKYNFSNN